jgi:hypothetical protein
MNPSDAAAAAAAAVHTHHSIAILNRARALYGVAPVSKMPDLTGVSPNLAIWAVEEYKRSQTRAQFTIKKLQLRGYSPPREQDLPAHLREDWLGPPPETDISDYLPQRSTTSSTNDTYDLKELLHPDTIVGFRWRATNPRSDNHTQNNDHPQNNDRLQTKNLPQNNDHPQNNVHPQKNGQNSDSVKRRDPSPHPEGVARNKRQRLNADDATRLITIFRCRYRLWGPIWVYLSDTERTALFTPELRHQLDDKMEAQVQSLMSMRIEENTMGKASEYASGTKHLVKEDPEFTEVMAPFDSLYQKLRSTGQLLLPSDTEGLEEFSRKVRIYVNGTSEPRTTHMVAACALTCLTSNDNSLVSQEPTFNKFLDTLATGRQKLLNTPRPQVKTSAKPLSKADISKNVTGSVNNDDNNNTEVGINKGTAKSIDDNNEADKSASKAVNTNDNNNNNNNNNNIIEADINKMASKAVNNNNNNNNNNSEGFNREDVSQPLGAGNIDGSPKSIPTHSAKTVRIESFPWKAEVMADMSGWPADIARLDLDNPMRTVILTLSENDQRRIAYPHADGTFRTADSTIIARFEGGQISMTIAKVYMD